MENVRSVLVKLHLPSDVAQDVILRHVHCATEWQQLPFDAAHQPVEIENLDGSIETDVMIGCIFPTLLDSILHLVSAEGWRDRYDPQTAVSVACSVCACALEHGVVLQSAQPVQSRRRRYSVSIHTLSRN